MEKFKRIISKLSRQNIFHYIIQSKQAKQQDFSIAVQQFSQYNKFRKQQILSQIFNTFKRQRSIRTNLTALILIDYLYSLQPQITLFKKNQLQPKVANKDQGKKNLTTQKIIVAEEHFVKFYYQFMKKSSLKTQQQINFLSCNLEDWIYYCQISIDQILEIIKIDFIINFLIKNSSNSNLIKKCLQSIFQKISFDFKLFNRFLEKYLKLIREKHQHSFKINQIYEKILFANKNIPKLNFIVKQLNKNIIFEPYKIDTELNKSIQMQIHQREQEKREYLISSRNIKSSRCKNGLTQTQKNESQQLSVEGDTMLRLNDFI